MVLEEIDWSLNEVDGDNAGRKKISFVGNAGVTRNSSCHSADFMPSSRGERIS